MPRSRWPTIDRRDPELIAEALAAFPLTALRVESKRSRRGGAATALPFVDDPPAGPGLRMSPEAQTAPLSLDATALSLLQQATARDGLRRDEVRSAPEATDAHIDRAARLLVLVGLAQVRDDVLGPAELVDDSVPLPLPLLRNGMDHITSEELARTCRALGVKGGTRKAERAAAASQVLCDPDHVQAVLGSLPTATVELFLRILAASLDSAHSPTGELPPGTVDLFALLPDDRVTVALHRRRRYGSPSSDNPLDQLADRLLIGSADWSSLTWVYLEVAEAFLDESLVHVVAPPEVDPALTTADPGRPLEVVAAAAGMLDAVAAQPMEAKKSGDRHPPVKAVRAAAKAAGTDPRMAGLLVDVFIDLGLLVPHALPAQGRGRNRFHPIEWRPHARRRTQFLALDPAHRWHRLAGAWARSPAETHADETKNMARVLLLAALASLPDGHGVPASQLQEWIAGRHVLFNLYDGLDDLVAEVVVLGIATDRPTVGLTPTGRALLAGDTDAAEVTETVSGGTTTFVVQPDHTLVTPPDLAPDVRNHLTRLAEVESTGGATVWRLSTQRLTELGATEHPDTVLAFLTEHADGDVPDNVVRLVRDAMGGAARLEVLEATCVVRCDDPATLADAARHRAAKLTVVAPGVATSTLERTRLVGVLRSKGVAVTAAGEVQAAGSGAGTAGSASSTDIIAELASPFDVGYLEPDADLPRVQPPALRPDRLAHLARALVG